MRGALSGRGPIVVVGVVLVTGCTSPVRSEEATPPPSLRECDAYMEAFARCMTRRQASDTTTAARDEMAARFARAATADEATRARVRAQCAEGEKSLAIACR